MKIIIFLKKINLLIQKIRKIVLQHLEPYFGRRFINFFKTINDLFYHLKDIFDKIYRKKYVMKQFQELKIGTDLFAEL